MNRDQLILTLQRLDSGYAEEMAFQKRFLDLLAHPRAYERDHLPGHITGSAWIVNETGTKVLLVLHAKLGRWLQPGGHADGDEEVLGVALREAEEETGLKNFRIPEQPFLDIDIHPIPARKDMPEHFHYDVRFLVEASEKEPLLISDESTDLRWVGFDELAELTGDATSIRRMAEKSKKRRFTLSS